MGAMLSWDIIMFSFGAPQMRRWRTLLGILVRRVTVQKQHSLRLLPIQSLAERSATQPTVMDNPNPNKRSAHRFQSLKPQLPRLQVLRYRCLCILRKVRRCLPQQVRLVNRQSQMMLSLNLKATQPPKNVWDARNLLQQLIKFKLPGSWRRLGVCVFFHWQIWANECRGYSCSRFCSVLGVQGCPARTVCVC